MAGSFGVAGTSAALVVALVLTARAFLVDDVGDGLLWLFVFTPLLMAAGYWLGVLFAGTYIRLVLRRR
jgi:hypothetical protein